MRSVVDQAFNEAVGVEAEGDQAEDGQAEESDDGEQQSDDDDDEEEDGEQADQSNDDDDSSTSSDDSSDDNGLHLNCFTVTQCILGLFRRLKRSDEISLSSLKWTRGTWWLSNYKQTSERIEIPSPRKLTLKRELRTQIYLEEEKSDDSGNEKDGGERSDERRRAPPSRPVRCEADQRVQFILKDARYFLIKSGNIDNVLISKSKVTHIFTNK